MKTDLENKKIKTRLWDPVRYLKSEEDIVAYLATLQ